MSNQTRGTKRDSFRRALFKGDHKARSESPAVKRIKHQDPEDIGSDGGNNEFSSSDLGQHPGRDGSSTPICSSKRLSEKGNISWADISDDDDSELIVKCQQKLASINKPPSPLKVKDHNITFKTPTSRHHPYPHGSKGPLYPQEQDMSIIARRSKQISFGKNTTGYMMYLNTMAKNERKKSDPNTPNKFRVYSRRAWDGLIKKWRQSLHHYDPSNGAYDETLDMSEGLSEMSITTSELDREIEQHENQQYEGPSSPRSTSSAWLFSNDDFPLLGSENEAPAINQISNNEDNEVIDQFLQELDN